MKKANTYLLIYNIGILKKQRIPYMGVTNAINFAIKRIMYGNAKIKLLSAKVIYG